ncbi:MAG: helix-turn-helix transcriptional regulator [Lachnospiraceae bacterium]|nr:helix-turn-helix transcriptional regulator [Lachnospiraceae bacterium]
MTLSNQLKQLEEGLVKRTEYVQIPPKVEYFLTEIGREFQPVLDSIQEFGMKYIHYMKDKSVDEPAG